MANKVIHKYPLQIGTKVSIDLPCIADVVKAAMQDGQPHIWVHKYVDDKPKTAMRHFYVAATGEQMPVESQYVDTVFQGPFVWHIFEVPANF